MLITPRGEPVPPQSVVRRLAAIDERLTIRWVPSVGGAYWAICETYRRGDERWALVQRGELREQEAFDILCMLPPDASSEEAEGILLRRFGRVEHAASEAQAQVERIARANAQQKQAHVDAFLREQEEKHERFTTHDAELVIGAATAHPISHGIGDNPRTSRRNTKARARSTADGSSA